MYVSFSLNTGFNFFQNSVRFFSKNILTLLEVLLQGDFFMVRLYLTVGTLPLLLRQNEMGVSHRKVFKILLNVK